MKQGRLDEEMIYQDVSNQNGMRLRHRFAGSMIRIGSGMVRTMLRILIALSRGILWLGYELRGLPMHIAVPLKRFGALLVQPISLRMAHFDQIQRDLQHAKKQGRKETTCMAIRHTNRFLWGKGGLFRTIFNYAAPIVCVAFAISVISYGKHLDYGLRVTYNGQELGIIATQAAYESAKAEVQQRIASVDDAAELIVSPTFTLTVMEDNMQYLSTSQLADEMLTSSNAELTEAYGVYVDGSFIGSVLDKSSVELALAERLATAHFLNGATNIGYQKTVEYQKGIYLTQSVQEESELIARLTETSMYVSTYTAEDGETLVSIANKFSMTREALVELNPDYAEEDAECVAGDELHVMRTYSYLPIQYTINLTLSGIVPYDTVEVETSAINQGERTVLVKGVNGEKSNVVDVIYVDGVETERNVLQSTMLKEPVSEQVGVGTYTAQPQSTSTALYGTGQFSWPVNGGYISDPFLSDRNHKGMDIAAPAGTEIYAAASGEVVYSGWNGGGYGYLVMIDHGDGYMTVYGHCSMLWVDVGQTVSRGQLLADVGSTGDSTGNHLHFEVRYNGVCNNPADYIRVNAG